MNTYFNNTYELLHNQEKKKTNFFGRIFNLQNAFRIIVLLVGLFYIVCFFT